MAVRSTSSSAPTSNASVGASLVPQGVHLGKPPIPLTRSFTLVGARNRAHLHLVSPSISKNHSAIISSDDGVVYVRDLSSRTHTIVNGKAVKEAVLSHGDKLQVGTFTFKISNRASLRKRPTATAPAGAIEVDGAEFPIAFEQNSLLIGRRPTCDIPLLEESVSTIHAIFFTVGSQRFIRDLGSRTGTFVNGSPIHQVELNFGDQIRVGDTTMRYEAFQGSGAHLDELEHLVGTAALDEALAIHPVSEPVSKRSEASEPEPIAVDVSAPGADDRIPIESEDDLIPLAQDEAIAPADEVVVPPLPVWEAPDPIAETPAEAPLPLAPETPVAPVEAEAEATSIEDFGLTEVDEEPLTAEQEPEAPVVATTAPLAPAVVDEVDFADLEFADEVAPQIPVAHAPAIQTPAVAEAEVEQAEEELEAVSENPEPSLAEDDAADEAEAAAAPPAPLRPEDTNFSFPKHDAEESAPEPVDLDFVPEAEHPAGLGGLDFSERAEAAPHGRAAHAPSELPELDLSGLTLHPPSDGDSADLGLDFADDLSGASASAAPLLNLGAAPAAAPGIGGFDLADAPAAPFKSEQRPPARKEKPAKKEKKTWWSRKRKSQEEAAAAASDSASIEPSPIQEAPVEETLDAQIERALSGSFGSEGTEEAALDAVEPFTPNTGAESVGNESDDSFAFTAAAGAPETAHDSFAGLDFSAVAAGSGLDFGGELDSVEPPTHAANVLPPQVASVVAESEVEPEASADEAPPLAAEPVAAVDPESAEADWEVADVIESTEPTPESALDLEDDLAIAASTDLPSTAPSLTSDITQITEPSSLSDTAFGRAVFDFSGSSLDPIVEAPSAPEPIAEPVSEADALRVADASAAAAAASSIPAAADLSFDQMLDEELGEETLPEHAAPGLAAESPAADADEFTTAEEQEADAASGEKPVFDLQGWSPPAAPPVSEAASAAPAEISEASAENEADLAFAPDDVAEEAADEELTSLPSLEAPAAEVSEAPAIAPAADAAEEEADENFEALAEAGTGVEATAALDVEAEPETEAADEPLADLEALTEDLDGDETEAAFEMPAHVPSNSVSPSIPEVASHPMVADLTSPTEDSIREIAADPADAGHLGAAEAIDFDLDLEEVPGLENATADDLAPVEPVEETLSEAFDNAIGRDEVEPEEEAAPLAAIIPAEAEALELSADGIVVSDELDSGLEFDEVSEEAELELAGEAVAEESVAAPEAPVAAEPIAHESVPDAPAHQDEVAGHLPSDPFFGLGRDSGSFLGGLPLALPPVSSAPPVAAAAAAPMAAAPKVPQAPQRRASGLAAFGSVPIGQVRRPGQPARPAAPALPPTAAAPTAPTEESVDSIDFADSGESAAPAKPKQPTPPPARNIPPRVQSPGHQGTTSMFDLGLGDVAGGAVEIPPLAGVSRPHAGQLTTAFDGLAFPSMSQTDVFSQLGPANDPVFGAAGRKSAAELEAEVDQALREEGEEDDQDADDSDDDGDSGLTNGALPPGDYAVDGEAEDLSDAPPAAMPGRADSKREKDRRPPGYTPPAQDPSREPAPPTQQPPKKRRWGVRFLLPMMFICGAGAAGAVYLLQPIVAPRHGTVTGVLEFERLKDLAPNDRAKFENDQRELLRSSSVLSSAADLMRSRAAKSNTAPGFLGGTEISDVRTADLIATNAKIPEGSGQVILNVDPSADPSADRVRMRWLLEELYLRNKSLQDKSGTSQRSYEIVLADLNETKAQIAMLKDRIAANREKSDAITHQETLNDLKLATEQLSDAWDRASKEVHDIQIDLDAAAGADVGDGAIGVAVPAVAPGEDPQLIQMTKQLGLLSSKLAAEKDAQNAQAAKATASINDALKKFQSEIGNAQKAMNGDGELSAYLASAQRMQKTMSDMYDRLGRQQATDRTRLNDLKKRLLEKSEAKLNEAWSSDSELKQLQETLSLKEHHRNAAIGSGLAAEAKKLEGEIAQLNARIQARRDLLGTGFAYDAEVKDLQKFIDDSLARMEGQRAIDEQQMAELFASLRKDAPSVEKLPAEQQKLAEALEQRSAELDAAREQYAKVASMTTSAAGAGSQNGAIEQQVTQMQASIDARKRQLADAAAQSLTQKQKQERLARLEQRKAELAEAKNSETRAFEAHKAKVKEYNDFKESLEVAQAASKQKEDDIKAITDPTLGLDAKLTRLTAEAQQASEAVAKAIVPMQVRESSVTVSMDPDSRPIVASITFVFVVVVFSALMFTVSHTPHHPHDSVPFAAAAFAKSQSGEGELGASAGGDPNDDQNAGFAPDPFNPAPRRGKPNRKLDTASQGDEHPLPV